MSRRRRGRAVARPPRVLTIAGSDSSGGAGLQADLKTFAAFGTYGMSAVTAVTAQNTRAVIEVQVLSGRTVARQIAAVAEDIGIDAAKTGMLGDAAVVRAVAGAVRNHRIRPLVVDPVFVSTTGHALLEPTGIGALITDLAPLAALVTPNRAEAGVLVGRRLRTAGDLEWAARTLADHWRCPVLVKGGHRRGDAVDVLADAETLTRYRAPRVRTAAGHGTGCTLSAAIAALLARRVELHDAVALAKAYVTAALRTAPRLGSGAGPLNHAWPGLPRLLDGRSGGSGQSI